MALGGNDRQLMWGFHMNAVGVARIDIQRTTNSVFIDRE